MKLVMGLKSSLRMRASLVTSQGGTSTAHEVRVLCNCDDIEHCRMEIYVSDIRIVEAQLRVHEVLSAD